MYDVNPIAALPYVPRHHYEVWNRTFCAGVELQELRRLNGIAIEGNLKIERQLFGPSAKLSSQDLRKLFLRLRKLREDA